MLYNLLFSATFSKDFSHLQGPPECPEWNDFKRNTFAYVIQKHEDSITQSGKKHLFYISNTRNYLAFGIYTSIHDYAKLGRVNTEYMLRRRGGDHSVHQTDATKGDYPTEASIGGFWLKKDNCINKNTFIDVDLEKLLKIYEREIPPFWSRPRDAARQEVPIVLESPLRLNNSPIYDINGFNKIINAINLCKKTLIKVNEKAEINLFYALIHAVINGSITAEFNFCTAFKSKAYFKGQRTINIGTIRTQGKGAIKAKSPIKATSANDLNVRNTINTIQESPSMATEYIPEDDEIEDDEIEIITEDLEDEILELEKAIAELTKNNSEVKAELPQTLQQVADSKTTEQTINTKDISSIPKVVAQITPSANEVDNQQARLTPKELALKKAEEIKQNIRSKKAQKTTELQAQLLKNSEIETETSSLVDSTTNSNNTSQTIVQNQQTIELDTSENDLTNNTPHKSKAKKPKNVDEIKRAALEKVAQAKKAALEKAKSKQDNNE